MNQIIDINIASYNHANYLRHTLDSVLSQQTTFSYRILIGDDCSTDGSIEIIKEYEKNFPDRILAIYQKVNLGLNHPEKNGVILLKKSTAKYIALLDGDDYWTDPLKLQKQIDFLEANPSFSMCFHNALVTFEDKKKEARLFLSNVQKDVFTVQDLCKKNIIPTASLIFRSSIIKDIPDWFYRCPFGDWPLSLFIAEHGKVKYFNEVMSVYRVHSGGIWSKLDRIAQLKKIIKNTLTMNQLFKKKYQTFFYEELVLNYMELCQLYRTKNIFYLFFYSLKLLLIRKYNKTAISKQEIFKMFLTN
jgi:glycosyltransferase involved in cell wall biosynthesis